MFLPVLKSINIDYWVSCPRRGWWWQWRPNVNIYIYIYIIYNNNNTIHTSEFDIFYQTAHRVGGLIQVSLLKVNMFLAPLPWLRYMFARKMTSIMSCRRDVLVEELYVGILKPRYWKPFQRIFPKRVNNNLNKTLFQ